MDGRAPKTLYTSSSVVMHQTGGQKTLTCRQLFLAKNANFSLFDANFNFLTHFLKEREEYPPFPFFLAK